MSDELKLTLEETAAPSLTLETPSLTLEPEKVEEEKPVEPATVEDTRLTEEERKMVDEFAKKIDVTNSQMVLQYGAASQKKLSDFSETALSKVRTKDLGEVGGMITDLIAELQGFSAMEQPK